MTLHRFASVEALSYPVIRVTFDDGVSGTLDLSDEIATGPIFAPLKDRDFFKTVAVGEYGHTFGWRLDELGHEIDFCPTATRIRVETQMVEEMAARFRARRTAAE
ncbi:molybdopterin-guanine dinucleotide biosynthesis protein [Methylobacterium sp. Leaf456]|uniref:DUF2442 domain-containing protein n=1 Tax=Methylobacterium sp. Leaf456 TaxID=1736382 RepID=UPI0006F41D72|nr:DUF2442 domain-containing protein [Methylobacterium sp. Leaf456]KQT46423.1 molybdopterin-guanine dinucleotide biosynthesis protein [Methylobacterium sp. Leaf456]